jgi:hypothetical protein
MNEREFEDILEKYPELIEDGLSFQVRQLRIKGKLLDLLYVDRHGQKLIVELKKGTVLREHVGQLMDYEGELLSPDDPTIRVMMVGNRVPENLRRSLEHHGFEWKELPLSRLIEFLRQKGDDDFLAYFASEEMRTELVAEPRDKKAIGASPCVSDTSGLTTRQKMLSAFGDKHLGEVLTRQRIIAEVLETFPGTKPGSVIPSDYCYNILNRDPSSFKCRLFEWDSQGQYKVLGSNFDYEGPLYWKGQKIGEWRKGQKNPCIWKTTPGRPNPGI